MSPAGGPRSRRSSPSRRRLDRSTLPRACALAQAAPPSPRGPREAGADSWDAREMAPAWASASSRTPAGGPRGAAARPCARRLVGGSTPLEDCRSRSRREGPVSEEPRDRARARLVPSDREPRPAIAAPRIRRVFDVPEGAGLLWWDRKAESATLCSSALLSPGSIRSSRGAPSGERSARRDPCPPSSPCRAGGGSSMRGDAARRLIERLPGLRPHRGRAADGREDLRGRAGTE